MPSFMSLKKKILIISSIVGIASAQILILHKIQNKSDDGIKLTIPTENLGPIMWREIQADCKKFHEKSFWILMSYGGFVSQEALFLHSVDGDTGLINADPLSSINQYLSKLEYFDESIRQKAGLLDHMQNVKVGVFTRVFDNRCFNIIYSLQPAKLEDQIAFMEHRNLLLEQQTNKN